MLRLYHFRGLEIRGRFNHFYRPYDGVVAGVDVRNMPQTRLEPVLVIPGFLWREVKITAPTSTKRLFRTWLYRTVTVVS